MKQLTTSQIRQVFLDFFSKHQHQKLEGASIIPDNDPTLLYINSGMAPLKSYFLGEASPPEKKMCNVQPCIRTNDIEDVGDRHHLTFFEMMGSWSIGDYYKEGAIKLAYDLLVNHFEYDPQKLYATVYKGNAEAGIPADTESIEFWKSVGLPEDHIVSLGDDNFWGPAGQTGPCGPCTEVFFDTGDEYGPAYTPGGHFDDVNRYIEIWNAGVFMELNKMADGSFENLPLKSVDTGAGVERMYMALNNCDSLYDVDVVKPIYDLAKIKFGAEHITQKDLRMVTDHIRSSTFILSEGVKPDKDGRGYIVRRLIRKCITVAVRAKTPPIELIELSNEVIEQLKDFYPQLELQKKQILQLLEDEIVDFEPAIKNGLELLNDELANVTDKKLDANKVFILVTTHGVPFEIVKDYAMARSVSIDEKEYEKLYREHQKVSRQGTETNALVDLGLDSAHLEELTNGVAPTEFTGYDELNIEARVLAILQNGKKVEKTDSTNQCLVVTDKTTFYAEGGGQAADKGRIENDNFKGTVVDVKNHNHVYIHYLNIDEGFISQSDVVKLSVDKNNRESTAKNHSATHLLHSALRSVLGEHVSQKGSLVNSEKLRFDFQHNKPLSKDEIQSVENLVNQWIWQATGCNITEESYQKAIASGVTALFGEKYQEDVRVVRFADFSAELCAGTHVVNSGQIGLVKILTETSTARGIRRMEAITGSVAYEYLSKSDQIISAVQEIIRGDKEQLVENIFALKKSAKENKAKDSLTQTAWDVDEILEGTSGLKAIFGQIGLDKKELIDLGEKELKSRALDVAFMVSPAEDKLVVVVIVSDKNTDKMKANIILKNWIERFDGRGGGKANVAQGGINGKIDLALLKNSALEALG
ncbi:MAG: alanine--tRNA ligase [Leptospirales bacterium]